MEFFTSISICLWRLESDPSGLWLRGFVWTQDAPYMTATDVKLEVWRTHDRALYDRLPMSDEDRGELSRYFETIKTA